MPDMMRSPRDSGHAFEITRADQGGTLLAPDGIRNVVIVTEEGSDLLQPIDVNADALRRRPRLIRTTQQIIRAANVRWALDGGYSQEAIDG